LKILLLSPHADDVELGCGGSIAKFKENGDDLFWVVFSVDSSNEMESEFVQVMDRLNLKEHTEYRIHHYKRRILHESRHRILQDLIGIREEIKPDLVFCPSPNDCHQDHQTVTNEAVRVFKKTASILCYELSWNLFEFSSQCFVELEKRHIENKLDLLKLYKSQIAVRAEYFSKDFIYGLAKVRGVQIGSKYAEAFEVIRWKLA